MLPPIFRPLASEPALMLSLRQLGWMLVSVCLAPCVALADVKLPAVFGDNMVLQQSVELPFWGWADAGEQVTVTVAGKSVMVTAAIDGRWSAKLPAVTKSGPVDVAITGKTALTLKNVVMGDVWLASGQSNMEWRVLESANAKDEIASAKHPLIRLFKVARQTALEPQRDVEGEWVECSPEAIPEFSAVAFSFGRELHAKLNRPIGLIQSTGGNVAEAWVSDATLKADPEYQALLEKTARANGDGSRPNDPSRTSVLYNGMIAPLQPFAIKGVVWYQGESNAGRAWQYRALFPALIDDWRRTWGQGDFPFLFVQLPGYVPDKNKPDHPAEPEASTWAELREAQQMSLAAPRTGMAVTIDIGEPRDIHPKNKQEVGRRLARQALAVAYNQTLVASGPMFRSMTVAGKEVHLQFHHVGGGLVARGGELKGFAVAGVDQKFAWARASIVGNKIVVSSDQVSEPVAVRYGWADNPAGNLFNKENLPASPFRTDDWPGITVGVHK